MVEFLLDKGYEVHGLIRSSAPDEVYNLAAHRHPSPSSGDRRCNPPTAAGRYRRRGLGRTWRRPAVDPRSACRVTG